MYMSKLGGEIQNVPRTKLECLLGITVHVQSTRWERKYLLLIRRGALSRIRVPSAWFSVATTHCRLAWFQRYRIWGCPILYLEISSQCIGVGRYPQVHLHTKRSRPLNFLMFSFLWHDMYDSLFFLLLHQHAYWFRNQSWVQSVSFSGFVKHPRI